MSDRLKWLAKHIFGNRKMKLLSLVLAAITWYSIRDAISFEVVIPDVKVEVKVREGMAILNQPATRADVTFRGSQEDISALDLKQIRIVEDLTLADARTEQVTIGPENVKGIRRGVRAVRVEPNRTTVTLDREGEKTVLVKGMYIGKPLLGQVESVVCEPGAVRLRGPAGKLSTTEAVYTEPVDVDGRIESFVKRSRVLPPSDTWVVRIDPTEVQVKVNVTQKLAEREWKNIPVLPVVGQGKALDVVIQPSSVEVLLFGRSEVLDQLRDEDAKVLVDCIGLKAPGEYDVPVYVHLPTEVEVSSQTSPKQVHVTLK